MEHSTISVVIPVYNAEETIEACLNGVLGQSCSPLEVIVVDNGSTDGVVGKVKGFAQRHPALKVSLVSESEKGQAACRNKGAGISRGEIVSFTDADCVPDPDWIRDVEKAFHETKAGGVAGNIKGYRPDNLIQEFLSLYTLRGLPHAGSFHRYTLTEGGFAAANLSVQKEVFEAVGGFDPKMRFGEDHDLCARIMEAGYPIRFIESGVVRHNHRRTIPALLRQSFSYGIGHAHLLRKYRRGVVLIEAGGHTFRKEPHRWHVWIQAISADKKMLFFVVLSMMIPWGGWLPALYMIYLSYSVFRKAKGTEVSLGVTRSPLMASLLVLKSFALTLGRWRGSLRYHVICL